MEQQFLALVPPFLMCVSDSNKHFARIHVSPSCCVSTALVAPLFVSQRRVNKFRRQPEQAKVIFDETWSGTNTCNRDVGGVFFFLFFRCQVFQPPEQTCVHWLHGVTGCFSYFLISVRVALRFTYTWHFGRTKDAIQFVQRLTKLKYHRWFVIFWLSWQMPSS